MGTVIARNQDAIANPSELCEVIQPSAFCQMGCGYCGQEHARRNLSPRDQDAFVARIRARLASGGYSDLRVSWFGAEPLAGMAVMRRMTPLLEQVASEADCGFSATIVTNGLALTEKVAEELVNNHKICSAEVTLDGLNEHHDRNRPLKTGRGTFEKIFANLLAVASRPDIDLRLTVRCNVARANAGNVSELIDRLAAHGLQRRVGFYVAPVHSWGNDAEDSALGPEEFGEMEIEWLAQMINQGFTAALVPPRKPIVCMAVRPDAELVDAYGQLFNCTEAPYVPAYGSPSAYETGLGAWVANATWVVLGGR